MQKYSEVRNHYVENRTNIDICICTRKGKLETDILVDYQNLDPQRHPWHHSQTVVDVNSVIQLQTMMVIMISFQEQLMTFRRLRVIKS